MAGFADDKENSFDNIMENVEDEQLSAVSDNLKTKECTLYTKSSCFRLRKMKTVEAD